MPGKETSQFDILYDAAAAAVRYRQAIAASGRAQQAAASYAACRLAWDSPTPETGMPAAQTIEALATLAEPGLLATTGGRFFGWVVGASHPVGVAADWLTSAWGQNCANHLGAPSAAAAEEAAARWLLVLVAAAGVYFFYGFVVPVLAALVIGFASWPLYRKLVARVGGNTTIAATIAIVLIVTFLVIPISLAVAYTTGEVRTWVAWAIHANRFGAETPQWIIALPLAQRYASITTLTGWLSPSAAAWVANYSTWPALYPAVPILVPDPASGALVVAPAAIPFLPA